MILLNTLLINDGKTVENSHPTKTRIKLFTSNDHPQRDTGRISPSITPDCITLKNAGYTKSINWK
jgi:hypothetical protein